VHLQRSSQHLKWLPWLRGPVIVVWLVSLLALSASLFAQEGAARDSTERSDSDLNSLGELTAGYQALEAGQYDVALHHYRSALDKAADSTYRFQAYFGIGSAFTAMSRHKEAVTALEQALEIRPDHAEALYMLGLAYAYADEMDKAVATLERAVAKAPDLAAAHHGLSLLYAQLGWYQQAATSCRNVLEIDADHIEAKIGLGVALYHQGAYPDAIAAFEEAVEQEPENPRTLYGLGLSYMLDGDEESAVVQYVALEGIDQRLAKDLYMKIVELRR